MSHSHIHYPHIKNATELQNLVAKAPSANLPAMLVAQLLPFVNNLSTRKWTDEDIVEDVQYLRDELTARFDSLTYAAFISFLFQIWLTHRLQDV